MAIRGAGLFGVRNRNCVVRIVDIEDDSWTRIKNYYCEDITNPSNTFWVNEGDLTKNALTPLEVLAWAAT